MTKKCIYCGAEISDSCVIDFCERCGVGVFGRKMFDTIVKNMEDARANGDLCHDHVVAGPKKDFDSFGRFG